MQAKLVDLLSSNKKFKVECAQQVAKYRGEYTNARETIERKSKTILDLEMQKAMMIKNHRKEILEYEDIIAKLDEEIRLKKDIIRIQNDQIKEFEDGTALYELAGIKHKGIR